MDESQEHNEPANKEAPNPKQDFIQLRIYRDLKKAIQVEAVKDGRSLTNYILKVLADKIGWKGKI